jgi:hypothetical protein
MKLFRRSSSFGQARYAISDAETRGQGFDRQRISPSKPPSSFHPIALQPEAAVGSVHARAFSPIREMILAAIPLPLELMSG